MVKDRWETGNRESSFKPCPIWLESRTVYLGICETLFVQIWACIFATNSHCTDCSDISCLLACNICTSHLCAWVHHVFVLQLSLRLISKLSRNCRRFCYFPCSPFSSRLSVFTDSWVRQLWDKHKHIVCLNWNMESFHWLGCNHASCVQSEHEGLNLASVQSFRMYI